MPDRSNIAATTNLIPHDKALTDFIFDLCGSTMDDAQLQSKNYAFHLHYAFRRKMVLDNIRWKEIQRKLPITDWDHEALSTLINPFAYEIVEDAKNAVNDSWGLKLIKTGYLSSLDKMRQISQNALNALATEAANPYTEALERHIKYLDSLTSLPFILEKVCLSLAQNHGYHYEPEKNAEMLAALLDTINLYTEQDKFNLVLKTAIKIAMPDLPLDGPLMDTIQEDLLPCVQNILQQGKDLEAAKGALFSKDPAGSAQSQARKDFLANMGVHFGSLKEVLQETFWEPIQQCESLASGIQGFSTAAYEAWQSGDHVARFQHVRTMFMHFDKCASISGQLDQASLPAWLKTTNEYYQYYQENFQAAQAQVANAANAVYESFGIFYQKALGFLPESLQWYFKPSNPLNDLMLTLPDEAKGQEPDEDEAHHLLAYMAFHEFIKQEPAGQAPALTEKLFAIFMAEISKASGRKAYSFEQYQNYLPRLEAIDAYANSLNQGIQKFQESHKQAGLLNLMHRLKMLESQCCKPSTSVEALATALKELEACFLSVDTADSALSGFVEQYLKPSTLKIWNAYLQKTYIEDLEKALDNPKKLSEEQATHQNALKKLYSRLKANEALSHKEYKRLTRCFPGKPLFSKLSKQLNIAEAQAYTPSVTPNRVLIERIQANFLTAILALDAVLNNLDNQFETCKQLKKLAQNGGIAELAEKKKAYISALIISLNGLKTALEDPNGHIALKICTYLKRETYQQALAEQAKTPKTELAKKMLRFAWHVCPEQNSKPDNFFNNLVDYALKDEENLKKVYKSQQDFAQSFQKHASPELMSYLNDPLTVANFMPEQEAMMDTFLEKFLGFNVASGQALLTKAADMAGSLLKNNERAIANMFPMPFMGEIALRLMNHEPIRNSLQDTLGKMLAPYTAGISKQVGDLSEAAKHRVYQSLGIKVQAEIEKSAYGFASGAQAGSLEARNAFALFYLQYRAIAQNNPALSKAKCLKFLFKKLNTEEIAAMVPKFEEYDRHLFSFETRAHSGIEQTKEQLNFLITNINFQEPAHQTFIRITLINNCLLMALDTAEQAQLLENETRELHQYALKKLKETVEKIADYDQKNALLKAIQPAEKRAEELAEQRCIKALEKTEDLLTREIQDRERQISIDKEARKPRLKGDKSRREVPRLSRSVMAVEWDSRKKHKSRFLATVGAKLLGGFTLFSFWYSLINTLLAGSIEAAAEGLLLMSGYKGVIGVSASLGGVFGFIGLAVLRFVYKFGMEIWNNRQEYKETMANPHITATRKTLYCIGLGLKHFAIALTKTLLTDYVTNFVLTKLAAFQGLRQFVYVYPSEDCLKSESIALTSLKGRVQGLKASILAGNYHRLQPQLEPLKQLMLGTKSQLSDLAANDARNKDSHHQDRLQAYWNELEKLQQLGKRFIEIQKLKPAFATLEAKDLGEQKKEAPQNKGQAQKPNAENIPNLISAYQAKKEAKQAEMRAKPLEAKAAPEDKGDAPTYFNVLVSGFFGLLEQANQYCTWSRTEPPKSADAPVLASVEMPPTKPAIASPITLPLEEKSPAPPLLAKNALGAQYLHGTMANLHKAIEKPEKPAPAQTPAPEAPAATGTGLGNYLYTLFYGTQAPAQAVAGAQADAVVAKKGQDPLRATL